jgi:sulfate permease, SulP family
MAIVAPMPVTPITPNSPTSPAGPAGDPANHHAAWRGEALAGLGATAVMVPVVLVLALIAYGPAGAQAAPLGITACLAGVVAGGLVMALVGRSPLPAAAPSAAGALIFAGFIAKLLADPSIDLTRGSDRAAVVALGGAVALATGLLTALMGVLRLGSLARFVPQPVLAGFMNGVAILIWLSQLPPLLGLPAGAWARHGVAALAQMHWPALALGVATAAVVWAVTRWMPRAPASLVGLVAGTLAAELATLAWPGLELLRMGALVAALPLPDALSPLAGDALPLLQRHAAELALAALLLALIGGLESILSILAIDQLQGTRSDPNRELLALAAANVASGLLGGLPLVYLRLRAIATLTAGGRSRRALVAGSLMLALVFALALPLVARLPAAVLAGIVMMLAVALVDRWTRQLMGQWLAGERSPGLQQSLLLVAAVCAVTLLWGFVAGVGVGVLLAMILFVRAMNRSLLRTRYTAAEIPSRRVYPPALEAVLASQRERVQVIELEGALFFGSAERLATEAEALAAGRAFMVLDFRRVSTIDASGAVTLTQLAQRLARGGVALLLAGVTPENRHGRALQALGASPQVGRWQGHADADHAIEAAERSLLAQAGQQIDGLAVALADCALLEGFSAAQFARLLPLLRERRLDAGEQLFRQGDPGDALFLVTAGSISVVGAAAAADGADWAGAEGSGQQRFVSFSPGMTLGETALLDGGGRTTDGVADVASTVFELPRVALQGLQASDPELVIQLYCNLARHLSERLRSAASAWRRAAA